MPDVMMSPGLEEIIDAEYEVVELAPQPKLMCAMVHPKGRIEGRLVSFVDFRLGQDPAGVEVAVDIRPSDIKNALQCGEFRSVDVSMDGETLTSRAIQGGWIQRREIRPGTYGMVLMLSARREDM